MIRSFGLLVVALSLPALAAAADVPVSVKIELRYSDLQKTAKAGEPDDAPTGKATLRFRQLGDTAWLHEKDVDLTVTMKGDKPEKYTTDYTTTLKADPKKSIEWQLALPTAKGKFLVFADTRETKSNGKLEITMKASGAPKLQDKSEWARPAAGTPGMGNTNLKLDLLEPETKKASAKSDAVLLKDGKIPITVLLRDPASGQVVGKSELTLDAVQKPVRFISHFFLGNVNPVAVKEGEPLDYRVIIPTEKGRFFVGEGKTTPAQATSSVGNSRLAIEATLALKEASEVPAWAEPTAAPAAAATPAASATPAATATPVPTKPVKLKLRGK